MLSLGWSEITIIVVIIVIVVGPKELPSLLKQLGTFSKKIKSISREFNTTINNIAKETEIDQIEKNVKKISNVDVKNKIIKETKIKEEFDQINESMDKLNKDIKEIDKNTKKVNE